MPLPDLLLIQLRHDASLTQMEAARRAGYSHATDLNNIERRRDRDAVRRSTLVRLRDIYSGADADSSRLAALDRLVDGDLLWDEVVAVHDTGTTETIFDLRYAPPVAR